MVNADSSPKGGCIGMLLSFFGIEGSKEAGAASPFRLRDDFLSAAELSFYRVLESVVDDRVRICPKVNLGDIFFVAGSDQRQAQWNRISRKHVDFLLCTKEAMKPVAGLELDDSSHGRSDRQERDALVESVFEQAGLPLLRVPARRAYSPEELRGLIESVISCSTPSSQIDPGQDPSVSESAGSFSPLCPKCGVPMVLRTGRRGAHQGNQFFGCQNYPKCRELIPV